jgi:hypothetical protein
VPVPHLQDTVRQSLDPVPNASQTSHRKTQIKDRCSSVPTSHNFTTFSHFYCWSIDSVPMSHDDFWNGEPVPMSQIPKFAPNRQLVKTQMQTERHNHQSMQLCAVKTGVRDTSASPSPQTNTGTRQLTDG